MLPQIKFVIFIDHFHTIDIALFRTGMRAARTVDVDIDEIFESNNFSIAATLPKQVDCFTMMQFYFSAVKRPSFLESSSLEKVDSNLGVRGQCLLEDSESCSLTQPKRPVSGPDSFSTGSLQRFLSEESLKEKKKLFLRFFCFISIRLIRLSFFTLTWLGSFIS